MNAETKRTYTADEIKSEVRKTVVQLREVARTQSDFNKFVETVLGKVVGLTGAHGALLWQVNEKGQPRVTHAIGNRVREVAPESQQHGKLVTEVIAKETPLGLASQAVVVAGETQESITNSSPFLLLFAPFHNRKRVCCGTIELLQRNEMAKPAQDGYLNFLGQIAGLFPRWHEHQDLRRLSNKESTWGSKIQFVTEVHRSIQLKETAYAIANEARRLLNCDRVSVARWVGKKCKVTAISSQDKFDNRSNVVRKLGAVATSCLASDTEIWSIGNTDDIAPTLAAKINDYLDESHSRTFAVIPLLDRPRDDSDQSDQTRRRSKPKKLGVLIIEYFDTEVSRQQINDDYELARTQSELAMANAERHGTIFMQPLLQKVGWMQQLLFRDHRIKTILAFCALILGILFLCLFKVEHKMKIHGVLQPTNRSDIHTIAEGVITELLVDHDDLVEPGQTLFRQKNFDIELQVAEYEGRIVTTQAEIEQSQRQRGNPQLTRADLQALSETVRALEVRKASYARSLEKLKEKQASLNVASNIRGTVITWNAKRRLEGKPFAANKPVMTIADYEGDWQLELKIPQGKIGYINAAFQNNPDQPLQIDYQIATNPSEKLTGELVDIAQRAEIGQSGNPEFRAFGAADMENREALKPGVGVTARVHCGKQPIGHVWTYQIIDYLRTWFF